MQLFSALIYKSPKFRYPVPMGKYESDFTQRVITVLENARLDAGISVQELIERSGIRRSSYFRKMRGETSFTTEDVDSLAKALGLDPLLVLRDASND